MEPGVILAVSVILLMFSMCGLAFVLARWHAETRIGRRDIGVVTDNAVTFVMDDLDYSVKCDSKRQRHVALSGFRHGRPKNGPSESYYLSLTVGRHNATADVLHEIYDAGALQCTLRPFKQAGSANPPKVKPSRSATVTSS